jgi:CRP/FNR family transcriptional regulator
MALAMPFAAPGTSVPAPDNRSTATAALLIKPPAAVLELPFRPQRFERAAVIYRPEDSADTIFLISSGRVKLTRVGDSGRETVLEIFRAGELFGESALFGARVRRDQAVAVEDATIAVCAAADARNRMEADAAVALWFAQLLAHRLGEANDRIATLSFDPIPRRLARVLLRNAQRFGSNLPDGRVRILPLTHEALAQQVATSREIVTHYMNDFRDKGMLEYSRKSIDITPKRLTSLLES